MSNNKSSDTPRDINTSDSQMKKKGDFQNIQYDKSHVLPLNEKTLRKNKVVAYEGQNMISDQYNVLKAMVMEKSWTEGVRSILITSSFKGEGKSLTSVNFSISLAKELGRTVLLIDADLRKPSIHHILGFKPTAGLSDYFLHNTPLEDIFVHTDSGNLLVLPGHLRIDNPTEIIHSYKMEQLVRDLKEKYPERYIIFDAPPLHGLADSLIFSKYVDGVILVVEAGKTQKAHVLKSIRLLEGRNLLGFVLNKSHLPFKKYYGYESYYR